MKLSNYLTLTALALSISSVAAYAQTSQIYRFGEGQTTVQPGNAHPTQPPAGAPAKGQQQQQQQPAPARQPQPKAESNHKPKHQHHYRRHVPAQDTYSHG
jgi:hypothetical protein